MCNFKYPENILTWHADKEKEIWLTKLEKRMWKQHSSTKIGAEIKKRYISNSKPEIDLKTYK